MIRSERAARLAGLLCLTTSWGSALWVRDLTNRGQTEMTPGAAGLLLATFILTFAGLALIFKTPWVAKPESSLRRPKPLSPDRTPSRQR